MLRKPKETRRFLAEHVGHFSCFLEQARQPDFGYVRLVVSNYDRIAVPVSHPCGEFNLRETNGLREIRNN